MDTGIQINRSTITALIAIAAITETTTIPMGREETEQFTAHQMAATWSAIESLDEYATKEEEISRFTEAQAWATNLAFALIEMAVRPDCRQPACPRDREPVDPWVFMALATLLTTVVLDAEGHTMPWEAVFTELSPHICLVLHLVQYHDGWGGGIAQMVAECRQMCGTSPCEHGAPLVRIEAGEFTTRLTAPAFTDLVSTQV